MCATANKQTDRQSDRQTNRRLELARKGQVICHGYLTFWQELGLDSSSTETCFVDMFLFPVLLMHQVSDASSMTRLSTICSLRIWICTGLEDSVEQISRGAAFTKRTEDSSEGRTWD